MGTLGFEVIKEYSRISIQQYFLGKPSVLLNRGPTVILVDQVWLTQPFPAPLIKSTPVCGRSQGLSMKGWATGVVLSCGH